MNRISKLELALKDVKKGTIAHIDILNDLSWELWGGDRERATALSDMANELSQKLDYERGKIYGLMGRGLKEWGNSIETAFNDILDASQQFEGYGDKKGEAYTKTILSLMYWSFGEFQKGFELVNEALDRIKAIEEPEGEAWAYNILSGYYFDRKDYKRTLKYAEKALKFFKKTDNLIGQARALNGMGKAYHFLSEHDKALRYQKRSLKISREEENDLSESRTLHDIGMIYRTQGKYDKALDYFEQSRKIRAAHNYKPGLSTTMLEIGVVYCHTSRLDEAEAAFLEAYDIATDMKAKPKASRALEGLGTIYERKNEFEKALDAHKKLHKLDKEAAREATDKKLSNIKKLHKIEASKKEAEIYRLRNVELRKKNEELEETLRQLNATQAQLVQSGKMVALGKLVAGIAHEINSPIGTIKSGNELLLRIAERLLPLLEKTEGAPEKVVLELRKTIKILRQSGENNLVATDRIIRIMESLKNFARLDEADFLKANIHDGLENTLTLMSREIGDRIDIHKDYGEVQDSYLYAHELNQVFMNLLMNAIQATPENGKITIRTSQENGNIFIRIQDNGKGIPAEKLSGLFEPGFTRENARVKMRTGLYTSYNIVDKHHGEIFVDSEVGKGTAFTIRIPANLNEILGARASHTKAG